MKIVSIRLVEGPSVYHNRETMIMVLDIGEWVEVPSTDIPHFTENLLKILPGLKLHTCSPGYVGGFVERLHRGTYMAHIVEHIALELSTLCGIEVTYGKTRYVGKPGRYEIVVRYVNEAGMKECLKKAVEVARLAVTTSEVELESFILKVKEIVSNTALGPSGQALADAARKLGVPCRRVGEHSMLQLGYGRNTKRVQAAVSNNTNLISVEIAQDKNLTKKILTENFIPTPEGLVVESVDKLKDVMAEFSGPYAVKPLDGNHGKGVVLNLNTLEELTDAFHVAQGYSSKVLVEEMVQGKDYRVLIVDGTLVAAAERVPARVIGDGKNSVLTLIDQVNSDPRRGNGHMNILSKIEIDEVMLNGLKKKGKNLNFIPLKNEIVVLRENANISSGGTAIDVTDIIHPEVKMMCQRAARIIGLDICGLDLMHKDITLPLDQGAKIIEVNAGPGLRMHLAPSEGQPRPVAEHIIKMLYPTKESSRIPIIAVTGTNGKTTTVRMLHKILSDQKNQCVGLTTTDGIWIGKNRIYTGDTTGPKSSRLILSDKAVDFAVLEVARGGLLRGGLAYDYSDVAVITNISADHIGQDGIEDLQDLLWIKSLVAERVKESGTVVLNADNDLTLSIRDNPRVLKQKPHFFLFSKHEMNAILQNHIYAGGSACWIEDGWIMVRHMGATEHILKVSQIPSTMQGLAEFQVYNVLASLAAALAAGLDAHKAVASLQAFSTTNENMGRLNLYKVRDSYVLLDYGHNQDALTSIGNMLNHFKGYTKTAVIGLPGDRSPVLLEETAAALSKYYDNFILKDDNDLRGRKPGEIPQMMRQVILKNNSKTTTEIVLNEIEAVKLALEQAEPNEIIAIYYDNFKDILELILQYDPEPINFIPLLPNVIAPIGANEDARSPAKKDGLNQVNSI